MNITKLNKQLEDCIRQHLFGAGDYLREEIYSCIYSYYDHQVEIDDPIVTNLFAIIDRNMKSLEREIIYCLKHDAQQREDLATLKICYSEDEDSEEGCPF